MPQEHKTGEADKEWQIRSTWIPAGVCPTAVAGDSVNSPKPPPGCPLLPWALCHGHSPCFISVFMHKEQLLAWQRAGALLGEPGRGV